MSETVATILNDEQVKFLRQPDVAKSLTTAVAVVQEIIGQLRDALPALPSINVGDVVYISDVDGYRIDNLNYKVVEIYEVNLDNGTIWRAVISNRGRNQSDDVEIKQLRPAFGCVPIKGCGCAGCLTNPINSSR